MQYLQSHLSAGSCTQAYFTNNFRVRKKDNKTTFSMSLLLKVLFNALKSNYDFTGSHSFKAEFLKRTYELVRTKALFQPIY